MQLKYLFECHFKDGTMLQQTEADVSTIDPERSAFYDVMQRADDVMVFGIYNETSTYAVDLRDGAFEVNGCRFFIPTTVPQAVLITATDSDPKAELQNLLFEPAPDQKYELVYFRRHHHVSIMGQSITPTDISHTVQYHLGWKTKDINGQEVQQTIIIP